MKNTLLIAAVATGVVLALPVATPAVASGRPGLRPTSADPDPVKIEVPMTFVATKGQKKPNTTITGNCGTAFLYVSRVGGDEAHIDYGFTHLRHRAVYVRAHAGMVNLDGDGTAVDSYSHVQGNVSSWERQHNLVPHPSYGGEYQVTAYIHSYGALGDCISSPGLIDYVYLF